MILLFFVMLMRIFSLFSNLNAPQVLLGKNDYFLFLLLLLLLLLLFLILIQRSSINKLKTYLFYSFLFIILLFSLSLLIYYYQLTIINDFNFYNFIGDEPRIPSPEERAQISSKIKNQSSMDLTLIVGSALAVFKTLHKINPLPFGEQEL